MITFNEDELKAATPNELVEEGLGLIARGIFRKGDSKSENQPWEAYEMGISVSNVITGMALDFRRIAKQDQKCAD